MKIRKAKQYKRRQKTILYIDDLILMPCMSIISAKLLNFSFTFYLFLVYVNRLKNFFRLIVFNESERRINRNHFIIIHYIPRTHQSKKQRIFRFVHWQGESFEYICIRLSAWQSFILNTNALKMLSIKYFFWLILLLQINLHEPNEIVCICLKLCGRLNSSSKFILLENQFFVFFSLSSFREWDVVYFILASQIYLLQSVCAILSMYQFKLCLIFYIPTIWIAYSFFCAQSVPFILFDHKSLSDNETKGKKNTKQNSQGIENFITIYLQHFEPKKRTKQFIYGYDAVFLFFFDSNDFVLNF